MEIKRKITLKYRKDGRLSTAVLSLPRKITGGLIENDEDINFNLEFNSNDKTMILSKTTFSEVIEMSEGKLIKFKKNIRLQKTKSQSNLIYIPLMLLKDFGIKLGETNYANISFYEKDNVIKIKLLEENTSVSKIDETKGRNIMGKIMTIKVNKGGVGKSFVTLQLGHYLARKGKKVLLLTSDSQNNLVDYAGCSKEATRSKGLKNWVLRNDGEIYHLRENLYFIPLETSTFGSHFLLKLPAFLEEKKKEYDYILIDSIPTMKIDTVFVECSDKLIIPCFCDKVTVEGAVNVILEAGADKILALIVNKYENKKVQNKYMEQIIEALEGTDIIFPNPIPNISLIENLLEKGKTIWESRSAKILDVKKSFELVADEILNPRKKVIEDNFDIEF